jgi:hypothetical protein
MGKLVVIVLCSALVGAVLAGSLLGSGGEGAAARRSSCPAGTQKFVHVCIEKAERDSVHFAAATAACVAVKRRLPTTAELNAFRQLDGITLSGSEWTGTIVSQSTAIIMNDAGQYAQFGITPVNAATAGFRCVA